MVLENVFVGSLKKKTVLQSFMLEAFLFHLFSEASKGKLFYNVLYWKLFCYGKKKKNKKN